MKKEEKGLTEEDAKTLQLLRSPSSQENEQGMAILFRDSSLKKMTRSIVGKSVNNVDDIKELHIDAILAVIEHVKKGGKIKTAKLSSFFYSVAKNIFNNKLRKKRNDESKEEEIRRIGLLNAPKLKKQQSIIDIIDNLLSKECAELIKLKAWGHSSEDIYKLTEIGKNLSSSNAVDVKHYRCRNQLNEIIEQNPELKNLI